MFMGFPWWVSQNLPIMQETQVQSLSQEDPLEKERAHTPVFLPGKFHGQRSLVGYSPWGPKELEMTEPLSMHAPIHVQVGLWDYRVCGK